MIRNGYFSPDNPGLFRPVIHSLLNEGDMFMLCADYEAYAACQEEVSRTFMEKDKWTRMCIINAAQMGKFSSDRTIREYAEEIWGIEPVPVEVG
jgi:starch phosphorylase